MNSQHQTDTNLQYVVHPFLVPKKIEIREYQVSIAQTAANQNTLVVLPTSLGKTIIALLTLVQVFTRAPQSKIFILSPTRPLILQHFQTFQQFLSPSLRCCLFSSNLSPVRRAYALSNYDIFFSTPQILQNDLKSGLYSLEGISQIIFDEAHKSRKKYAYTYVAAQYLEHCANPLILALTASPGKDLFLINDLCSTLQIEEIVFRRSDSEDVSPYVFPIDCIFHRVSLPIPINEAQQELEGMLQHIINYLTAVQVLPPSNYHSKMHFLALIHDLHCITTFSTNLNTNSITDFENNYQEELNYPHLRDLLDPTKASNLVDKNAIFAQALIGIYLEHLKEILTTQDVRMFHRYIDKLRQRAENGQKRIEKFLDSRPIKRSIAILQGLTESPKIQPLKQILYSEFTKSPSGKFIIFTHYREMGQYLVDALNGLSISPHVSLRAKRFVGQASKHLDPGLSQKQQAQMITEFRNGDFNVMVATSVAEEGLDIPNVNAVIFYDAVPSEIRLIQRRGRTGRHMIGRCHFLVSPNTLDEIYHHVSHVKEAKMQDLLQHPKEITTVSPLIRSSIPPVHLSESLKDLKIKYSFLKEERKYKMITNIETQLQTHHPPILNNGCDKTAICDVTKELTQIAKNRLCANHNIDTTNEITIKKNKLRKRKPSKSYSWLIQTLPCIGSSVSNCIYCDLIRLYQTAKEEQIKPLNIDIAISYGISIGELEVQRDFLIYKNEVDL